MHPQGAPRRVSLAGLRRELIKLMLAQGRPDLARDALNRVVFTDDGATVYAHVLPKASWPRRRPGQAYVLAYADKSQLCALADFRALLTEAWLLLHDEAAEICRWLDGG
jgi:hypothetical protein